MTIGKRAILPVLAVVAALVFATTAGADQNKDNKPKAQREWPAVSKAIKDGNGKGSAGRHKPRQ